MRPLVSTAASVVALADGTDPVPGRGSTHSLRMHRRLWRTRSKQAGEPSTRQPASVPVAEESALRLCQLCRTHHCWAPALRTTRPAEVGSSARTTLTGLRGMRRAWRGTDASHSVVAAASCACPVCPMSTVHSKRACSWCFFQA